MITWIQVLLQKHHKVIFTILLFVIIVAFVFTIGSSIPFFGNKTTERVSKKDFYGFNLDDPHTINRLNVQAKFELLTNSQRVDAAAMQTAMLRYAYLTWTARQLGILRVSDADFAAYIQSLPAFTTAEGAFDKDAFRRMQAETKLSENEFAKILAANALADKIEKLIGGPGYVLEAEIKSNYNEAYGLWNVEIASFPYESFKPEITVDEAKLKEYFNANIETFRIPAAVGMDVVFFPAAEIDREAVFSAEEIRRQYAKTYSKYITFKDEQPFLKELEEVRDAVIEDLRKSKAVEVAYIGAEEIATKLYEAEAKFNSDIFKRIVSEAKLAIKSLPLIRPSDTTFPEGISAAVIKAGYALNENTFYGDPVIAEDGAWLVFFRERKESYIPEFAEVKDTVETMYKNAQKARLFSEKGVKAAAALQAAVKDGKKFEDAAKAEGFTVAALDKFSFANPAYRNQSMYTYLGLLGDLLPKMKAGDVSAMVTRPEAGYIVYASAFEAPKLDENSTEYKNLAANAKMLMRNATMRTIFMENISGGLKE